MSVLGSEVQGAGLDLGFVCQGWAPDLGGVESHAQDLARELIARGHRVHVLCLDGREGLQPYATRDERDQGVHVRRMAYRYHDHGALADLVLNRRAEDVIAAWLAETPCDLVHVMHLSGFGLGALRAIHDLGQPLVMTLHDYWPLCPRGQMLRVDGSVCAVPEPVACASCIARTWPHLMPSQGARAQGPAGEALTSDERAAEARTAYAVACLALPQRLYTPSSAARAVYERAGVPAGRVRVLENGIELAELAQQVAAERAARAGTKDERDVHLGVLGSVLPSKGVLELARSCVAAALPNLHLHVHGNLPSYHGDTSTIDALRALAESDARVHVHGPYARSELPRILAGLDGVAAPSRWEEVFGLSVREARAAGLPVLVSDAGDLARVAQDGEAGLVVPRDDAAAWTHALRRFAGDAQQRARWAQAPSSVRGARAMMLELEREYVAAIVELTGREPRLAQPLEPLGDAQGAASRLGQPSAAPAARAAAPAAAARGPWWKRLLGG
jgi:glycosyltransferase involved in cell wall biosynthesis